jgi:hypothetical protein
VRPEKVEIHDPNKVLVELASLGILLRVAGQVCPYTLPRDMVSVGWWKRGWELVPIPISRFGSLG